MRRSEMKVHINTGRKPRIEMLPLIDIVFLLLVFFIYAMLSMAVHRGLPVRLPSSATSEIDKNQVLSVTIKSDSTVYIDNQKVMLELLAEHLKGRYLSDIETGVLLFADKEIPYEVLFSVLDQIRIAGINRVSLQSEVK
jgi:biopolymer transport protein ExbD